MGFFIRGNSIIYIYFFFSSPIDYIESVILLESVLQASKVRKPQKKSGSLLS